MSSTTNSTSTVDMVKLSPSAAEIPVKERTIPRDYTMFYRHGMNSQCSKNFNFIGTFHEAYERAQKHCKVMGYKFIFLRPLINDLDDEEKMYLNPPVRATVLPINN